MAGGLPCLRELFLGSVSAGSSASAQALREAIRAAASSDGRPSCAVHMELAVLRFRGLSHLSALRGARS